MGDWLMEVVEQSNWGVCAGCHKRLTLLHLERIDGVELCIRCADCRVHAFQQRRDPTNWITKALGTLEIYQFDPIPDVALYPHWVYSKQDAGGNSRTSRWFTFYDGEGYELRRTQAGDYFHVELFRSILENKLWTAGKAISREMGTNEIIARKLVQQILSALDTHLVLTVI